MHVLELGVSNGPEGGISRRHFACRWDRDRASIAWQILQSMSLSPEHFNSPFARRSTRNVIEANPVRAKLLTLPEVSQFEEQCQQLRVEDLRRWHVTRFEPIPLLLQGILPLPDRFLTVGQITLALGNARLGAFSSNRHEPIVEGRQSPRVCEHLMRPKTGELEESRVEALDERLPVRPLEQVFAQASVVVHQRHATTIRRFLIAVVYPKQEVVAPGPLRNEFYVQHRFE